MSGKLYKYSGVHDYVIRNIEEGEIAFTHIDSLNDPFEGIGRVVYSNDLEEWDKLGIDVPGMLSDKFSDKNIERIRNKKRVLCLTTSWYNSLLWAHYADMHRGVCLEYDEEDVRKIASEIRRVEYSSTIATVDANSKNKPDLIFNKSLEWDYEEEVRAIYCIDQSDMEILDNYKILKTLVERSDDRYTYFFDERTPGEDLRIIKAPKVIIKKCKVTGIYMGLRISKDNKEKIRAIAKREKIPVWQMFQSKDSYTLDKRDASDFIYNAMI